MPLKTREIKLFWRDIPGFCWDIPAVPEKFEKKKFGFNFCPLPSDTKLLLTKNYFEIIIFEKLRISRVISGKSLSFLEILRAQIPSKITKNNSQRIIFVIILCQRVFLFFFFAPFCPVCPWDGWGSCLGRLPHEGRQKHFNVSYVYPAPQRTDIHKKSGRIKSAKTKRGRREGDGKKNVTTICDNRHDNLRHGHDNLRHFMTISSRVGSKTSVGYGTPPP